MWWPLFLFKKKKEDDLDVPVVVSLGKPRMVVQHLVPILDEDSDSGETVGEEAQQQLPVDAVPVASEPASMFVRFRIASLLQSPTPVLMSLKEQMLDGQVLREALKCVGDPSASELMRDCSPGPVYEATAARLVAGICEVLLEPSPQGLNLLRNVLEQGLLAEVWRITELAAPLRVAQAFHFRGLVERFLRRHRDKMLDFLLTPLAGGEEGAPEGGSSLPRSESIRLPVFRLFRHLESEHIAAVLGLALDKEVDGGDGDGGGGGGGGGAPVPPPRGRGNAANRIIPMGPGSTGKPAVPPRVVRWSNRFDMVRVLLHKMRVTGPTAEDPVVQDEATNAAMLLAEVLKHSNTHVDLLKSVMMSAGQLFELALGTGADGGGGFHMVQFSAAWSVLLDLCRCVGRIWLPNRHTRIISDTVHVYVSFLPQVQQLFESQGERLGTVRVQIAELVSVMLSGRLVSLFVEPLLQSKLLASLLDSCWKYPHASLYHLIVFSGSVIPMLQNCVASGLPDGDDVFAPAAPAVQKAVRELGLWQRIVDSHFSYDEGTVERRNKYAFNGMLTQLGNALVNSSCPMEDGGVLAFVSSRLDWTNTLENTPLTAMVYSKKTRPNDDDVESDDEEHENEHDGDGDAETDAATLDAPEEVADPQPDIFSPMRVINTRVSMLSGSSPKAVGEYSSPPRPRIAAHHDEDEKDDGQNAEEEFNSYSFWTLPIDDV